MRRGYNNRKGVIQEPGEGTGIRRVFDWFRAHLGEIVTMEEVGLRADVRTDSVRAMVLDLSSYGLVLQRVGTRPGVHPQHPLALWKAALRK